MEDEPDTTNLVYIDEYPELKKKVWLRRLNEARQLGVVALHPDPAKVLEFPDHDPDGAA